MTRIDASDPAATIAAVRAAPGDVAVVIGPTIAPLDRAQLIAVIGPLAIERTPARVNALDFVEPVAPEAVVEVLAFLESADCTTGQVLRLTNN